MLNDCTQLFRRAVLAINCTEFTTTLRNPKRPGIGGIHLTYKYNGEKVEYKDYFVELQLRSKIQHAWATAVEIVDTFTKQALKSSRGTQDWLDFFRMAGAEFAKLEKRPVGASVAGIDTKAEVVRLSDKLNVIARLNAFAVSADHIIQKKDNRTDYFLLELTNHGNTIVVTQFKTSDLDKAAQSYLQKEKQAKSDPSYDVVLVAATSMHALHSAYPNYFADSKDFVKYLGRVLALPT